ncbi:MAG: TrmH family RNA methyltransferase [Planctomycetota bacterium]
MTLSNARRRELTALTSRHQRRKRPDVLLLEGPLLIEALLRQPASAWQLQYVVVADDATGDPAIVQLLQLAAGAGVPVESVAADELATWCSTVTPQGALAVAAPDGPAPTLASVAAPTTPAPRIRLLVLDGVQDPGNVGTLIRSAAAFGAGAVCLCAGCADLSNPRVLRASMGGAFALPVLSRVDRDELADALEAAALPLVVADIGGEPYTSFAWPADGCALALGAEVAGASSVLRARAGQVVGIPQRAEPQSINVAMAGSILLAFAATL